MRNRTRSLNAPWTVAYAGQIGRDGLLTWLVCFPVFAAGPSIFKSTKIVENYNNGMLGALVVWKYRKRSQRPRGLGGLRQRRQGGPQGDTRGDLVLRVRLRIRTVDLIVVNLVGAPLISMLGLYHMDLVGVLFRIFFTMA